MEIITDFFKIFATKILTKFESSKKEINKSGLFFLVSLRYFKNKKGRDKIFIKLFVFRVKLESAL